MKKKIIELYLKQLKLKKIMAMYQMLKKFGNIQENLHFQFLLKNYFQFFVIKLINFYILKIYILKKIK